MLKLKRQNSVSMHSANYIPKTAVKGGHGEADREERDDEDVEEQDTSDDDLPVSTVHYNQASGQILQALEPKKLEEKEEDSTKDPTEAESTKDTTQL